MGDSQLFRWGKEKQRTQLGRNRAGHFFVREGEKREGEAENSWAETGQVTFSVKDCTGPTPTPPAAAGHRGKHMLVSLGLNWPLTRHVILRKSLPFLKPQFPSLWNEKENKSAYFTQLR